MPQQHHPIFHLFITKGCGMQVVPYIAWVSFATILNFAIWNLNHWKLGQQYYKPKPIHPQKIHHTFFTNLFLATAKADCKLAPTSLRTARRASANSGLASLLLRGGKSGGSVFRMTVFRKFDVCASYEQLWWKSPPSASRQPLCDSLVVTLVHFYCGLRQAIKPAGERQTRKRYYCTICGFFCSKSEQC